VKWIAEGLAMDSLSPVFRREIDAAPNLVSAGLLAMQSRQLGIAMCPSQCLLLPTQALSRAL